MSLIVIPNCKKCKGIFKGPIDNLSKEAVLECNTFALHHPECLSPDKRTTWKEFFKYRDSLVKENK